MPTNATNTPNTSNTTNGATNNSIAYLPIFFKVLFLGFVIFAVLSFDQFPALTTRQKLNIIGLVILFYTIIEILFAMQLSPCQAAGGSSTSPTIADILSTI
eukprot:Pompholyxophrys_sp_v1_NODE_22_length_3962_cov_1.921423.p7 type:complete len:101 gc:universal NODE_22_length_3962_cov_1.921423:700-398(-)